MDRSMRAFCTSALSVWSLLRNAVHSAVMNQTPSSFFSTERISNRNNVDQRYLVDSCLQGCSQELEICLSAGDGVSDFAELMCRLYDFECKFVCQGTEGWTCDDHCTSEFDRCSLFETDGVCAEKRDRCIGCCPEETQSPTNAPTNAPTNQPSSKPTGAPFPTIADLPTTPPTQSFAPTGKESLKPTSPPASANDIGIVGPPIYPDESLPKTVLLPASSEGTLLKLKKMVSYECKDHTSAPIPTPTMSPTLKPTPIPTNSPTDSPSKNPTNIPSTPPSLPPSRSPTFSPAAGPSNYPTAPTNFPSLTSSSPPSSQPTTYPTPVISPTQSPTSSPTGKPTNNPTEQNVVSSNPTGNPTPVPTTSPASIGYILIPGGTYGSCPPGREVAQEECLSAANDVTAGITTISNRDALLVNDWNGLPCGCFVWADQMLDYDFNCANEAPHPDADLVCLKELGGVSDYTLLPGHQYSECPSGQEVAQEDCLSAANALTANIATISNRNELLLGDWASLPCGCFIYQDQMIDFDTYCGNNGLSNDAKLVCKKTPTIETDYVLLSGSEYSSCPSGREVPESDCLAVANEMTSDMTTIINREHLQIYDWNFTPCGCFVWADQMLDFDPNCSNRVFSSSAKLVCLSEGVAAQRRLVVASDYMFYSGADYSECPQGQSVPQEECLAASNALTADFTTITNRNSLLVNDWSGLPCGCFVWDNQKLDFDPNCVNKAPHPSANLVCRHPDLVTSAPTVPPTMWIPPPPIAFPAGRSYNGLSWESVHPIVLDFSCNDQNCSVLLPPEECSGIYYVVERYAQEAPLSPEQDAVRLLTQATFGASRESVNEFLLQNTPHQWIKSQMDSNMTRPSLHREHYRARSNSHVRQSLEKFGLRDPCQAGSRWNRWAFNRYRDVGKTIDLEATSIGTYILKVDGIPRTEIDSAEYDSSLAGQNTFFNLYGTIYICRGQSDFASKTGAILILANSPEDCGVTNREGRISMPIMNFVTDPSAIGLEIPVASLEDLNPPVLDVKLLSNSIQSCTLTKSWPNFIQDSSDGSFYIEDRRVQFLDLTDAENVSGEGLTTKECPTAPRTFLNEESCIVRSDCSPPEYQPGSFALDEVNVRRFYDVGGQYVYRVEGLPIITDTLSRYEMFSPCNDEATFKRFDWTPFRFVRKEPGACSSGIVTDATIHSSISQIVASELEKLDTIERNNKRVLDIVIPKSTCYDPYKLALGGSFDVIDATAGTTTCWTHSHPDEWSVFVMDSWTLFHPGNLESYLKDKQNPIAAFAESNSAVTLEMPSWHPDDRFQDSKRLFDKLGNWGDSVSFNDLPPSAKNSDVLSLFGAIPSVSSTVEYRQVCPSPGEIANVPLLGNQFRLQKGGDTGEMGNDSVDQDGYSWNQKNRIWNTISTFAKDQLRQKVAWVLSSIFVVTAVDINMEHSSESYASYHDIFVRNAFGNYFDIMREVSFHPMMGKMLTYLESKSMAYSYENDGLMLFPDENYAREIMQLFTIGLFELNGDGTYVMDESVPGKISETYTNEDIMDFSRAWTNFHRRDERPNLEVYSDFYAGFNYVDPMVFPTTDGRDAFPKIGLWDKGKREYIGDRVKRCDDMPAKSWLRKGAKYVFRGSNPNLDFGRKDPDSWDGYPNDSRVVLSESSNLHSVLCNAGPTGECRFKSTVILSEDIDCFGTCTAGDSPNQTPVAGTLPCECSIDEPRTVRVDQSSPLNFPPAWYEYVKDECIRLAFPESGNMKAISEIGKHWGSYGNDAICADTRLAEAGTTCCDPLENNPRSFCIFRGERTTYATAKNRCEELGLVTCAWSEVPISDWCGTDIQWWGLNEASGMRFSWTNEDCAVSVQINGKGYISIVHDVGTLNQDVKGRVRVDVGTYFRVLWDDGEFPTQQTCDDTPGCIVRDSTCLCSTSVQTSTVFPLHGMMLPTKEELLAHLHIGAPDPSLSDKDYIKCKAPLCLSAGFDVHFNQAVSTDEEISSALSGDAIFEVLHPVTRRTLFLSNKRSVVSVGSYSFRNPPMFNSLSDQTQRDALYETDNVLWQYFTHSNTAPFVSMRLIQHLVSSNPSPGYVSDVSKAFSEGVFGDFGSGNYGDLEATVAAVLLHNEARLSVLDWDSTHGKAKEPLVKVISILRAMELGTLDGRDREVDLIFMKDKIGQESHYAPSVFSFFLPEFAPVGPVFDLGLVAPETQLYDPPKLIGFVNGITSTSLYGIQDCENGFGPRFSRYALTDHPSSWIGCYESNHDPSMYVPHRLRYTPSANSPEEIILEMDLLLTGGRLTKTNKAIITEAYKTKLSEEGESAAVAFALSHFSVTPEFQVTNMVFANNSNLRERKVAVPTLVENAPPTNDFKAIVYLYFAGGLDSYSLLMPHTCAGNLNSQYHQVRGNIAISNNQQLQINAGVNPQPCSTFGVHPRMPFLRDLYNQGDASFIANIGTLVESISNSTEFEQGSKKIPPSLFAHNIQTGETQSVSPDPTDGGVLGRIGDALNFQADEEVFDAYSISGSPKLLDGSPGVSRPADVLTEVGVSTFTPSAFEFESNMKALNRHVAESIYAETFSEAISSAIGRKNLLEGAIGDLQLSPTSETCFTNLEYLETPIALQLKQVARILKQRNSLQSKRSAFYVQLGSFDAHGDNSLGYTGQLLSDTNAALQCFVADMKTQGIWNDVTIISASEFGRTLTSNGAGTDHAWGGNHFLMGGQVAGGKIHGKYPDDFSDEGPLNIGRGRIIPTTPWEGLWKGVAEWFGVRSENMGTVLPNIASFNTNILGKEELYK